MTFDLFVLFFNQQNSVLSSSPSFPVLKQACSWSPGTAQAVRRLLMGKVLVSNLGYYDPMVNSKRNKNWLFFFRWILKSRLNEYRNEYVKIMIFAHINYLLYCHYYSDNNTQNASNTVMGVFHQWENSFRWSTECECCLDKKVLDV